MEEIKKLLEQQNKTWEEFRKTNDERLAALEAKGAADPLTVEKAAKLNDRLDEIQKQLDELSKKAARPRDNFVGESRDEKDSEYKAAFSSYLKKGDTAGFDELRTKDMQIGVDADGGYAVPEELDRAILTLMRDRSPMRQVCNQMTIGGVEYRQLVNTGGTTSGWVGETDPRPKTDTPKFTEIRPVMGEVYANPAATQTALDDVFFNAEQWLAEEVAEEFAKREGLAFLSGDGSMKPKGILDYPQAAQKDGVRPYGTLELVSAATAGTLTADDLIKLIYTLKGAHRANAHWMLNRASLAVVRMLKDGGDRYLWLPTLKEGQPSTILGYPIAENEDMADVGASGVPILFGDFKRTYTIVDRMGIRTLRDPYTNKPFVHFYTTKRVGGMLRDSESLKLLSV